MNRPSFACKPIIILALVLFAVRSASHAQSADPAVSRVYLPLVNARFPALVQIYEANLIRDRGTNQYLLGDVDNVSDQPVYDIVIELWLYDYYHQLLKTFTGTTLLTATLPGQLNPFCIFIGSEGSVPVDMYYWEATITGWSLISDRTYHPATTTITRVEEHNLGTGVDVEVRNDGSEPLMDVGSAVWSIHQATTIYRHPVAAILAPGETMTYTEFLYGGVNGYTSTVRAAAQGYIAP